MASVRVDRGNPAWLNAHVIVAPQFLNYVHLACEAVVCTSILTS